MTNYDTFTFEHKSHYNEFCPDTKLEFIIHQEYDLEGVINMMVKFLRACGYTEESIRARMAEYAED